MPTPPPPLGAILTDGGVSFTVWAPDVERLDLLLDDAAPPPPPSGARTPPAPSAAGPNAMAVPPPDRAAPRPFDRADDGTHSLFVPGVGAGQTYALRAGEALLVDPYALAIDRPYGPADIPRAIVTAPQPVPHRTPRFRPGGTVYELAVRPFTMLHPDVPEADRGTLRALAHPAVIAHLKRLHIDAVELMPVVAWINERHLAPLHLTNGWGYNPVTFMPVDPRLGTLDDLRASTAALHDAGIDVILDLVFNHTGESDIFGRTLSFRGLANHAYYRHADDGSLINDTGCGNTVACDHPMMRRMILDTLRHFVRQAGVDGFRFDLAPILGRTMAGFASDADLLREIAADPILADRILIAEPWDIGPGGYQLGRFAAPFLEWSDRYRDDMRLFWRGDPGRIGSLATRLAGSSDIFGDDPFTRTVNFLAAHDGFTLADMVAHKDRHNLANGEDGRDGHGENYSWNNGVEGPTDDPAIRAARRRDVKALLSTLHASRGTIMLTAGDEFGRSQQGNNNAYCQDNRITWIDWTARDAEIEAHAAALAALRHAYPELGDPAFLGEGDVAWLTEAGTPMTVADWEDPARETLQMQVGRILALFNRSDAATIFTPPPGDWAGDATVPPRSVAFLTRKEPSA